MFQDVPRESMFFKRIVERHMLAGSLGLLAWLIVCAACAQSATVPNETLGDAKLSPSVKAKIYRALGKEFEGEDLERSAMDGFEVRVIHLGPDGRRGLRVWGASNEAIFVCGATGNCPIWVFDPSTGALLLSASGWELRAETTAHNGCYDFVTKHNTSATSGIRDWYRFDGHVYKQVRETEY
jgi:hypothetical protein